MSDIYRGDYLQHIGVKGMKWGVRRAQKRAVGGDARFLRSQILSPNQDPQSMSRASEIRSRFKTDPAYALAMKKANRRNLAKEVAVVAAVGLAVVDAANGFPMARITAKNLARWQSNPRVRKAVTSTVKASFVLGKKLVRTGTNMMNG